MKDYDYYYSPIRKLDASIMALFNGFVFTDLSDDLRRDNVIRILGIIQAAYWLDLIDSHDYMNIHRFLNDYLYREFKHGTV